METRKAARKAGPGVFVLAVVTFATPLAVAGQGKKATAAAPVKRVSTAYAAPSTEATDVARQKEMSRWRMERIYAAIQDYRRDHKKLARYLSDLYPHYIGFWSATPARSAPLPRQDGG